MSQWPLAELDEWLSEGEGWSVRIRCESEEDAKALRMALYNRRRKYPSACTITIEGDFVKLTPKRKRIISAERSENYEQD